jgi:hypothetical protein
MRGEGTMKDVEIPSEAPGEAPGEMLGEAPGEIPGETRIGSGIGAATVAGASLRRIHEKNVNPVGIASEHRDPKPGRPIKLRPLLDRPSGR